MDAQSFDRAVLAVIAGALAIWAAVAWFLPVLLPFAIGLAVASAAQPLVRRLQELRLPRWAASALCVGLLFGLLVLLVYLLGRTVVSQLGGLAGELPAIARSAGQTLRQWLDSLCARAPAGMEDAVRSWTDALLLRSERVGERLSDAAIATLGGAVTALPEELLFTVTAVLSGFMLCARLPELRQYARKKLPLHRQAQLEALRQQLRQVLGGWCRAQAALLSVSFCIVTAGLLLLRVPYALGLGALIAFVDALPVLGAGTVLLPWAAVVLLRGRTRRALGLVLLYAAAALTRTTLEPRLLGRHLGLHPLIALVALYAGFRLCGVGGMLLFPIGAILLRQLVELWTNVRRT